MRQESLKFHLTLASVVLLDARRDSCSRGNHLLFFFFTFKLIHKPQSRALDLDDIDLKDSKCNVCVAASLRSISPRSSAQLYGLRILKDGRVADSKACLYGGRETRYSTGRHSSLHRKVHQIHHLVGSMLCPGIIQVLQTPSLNPSSILVIPSNPHCLLKPR